MANGRQRSIGISRHLKLACNVVMGKCEPKSQRDNGSLVPNLHPIELKWLECRFLRKTISNTLYLLFRCTFRVNGGHVRSSLRHNYSFVRHSTGPTCHGPTKTIGIIKIALRFVFRWMTTLWPELQITPKLAYLLQHWRFRQPSGSRSEFTSSNNRYINPTWA